LKKASHRPALVILTSYRGEIEVRNENFVLRGLDPRIERPGAGSPFLEECLARLARHSSQSLVKGDYRDINVSLTLGDCVLCLKLSALGIQQRQEIDYPLPVA